MQNKKLAAKNYYYIYGKHPVFSALNNPNRQIENILCTQMIFDANNKLIGSKPYKIVTSDVLSIGVSHLLKLDRNIYSYFHPQ